MKFHGLEIPKTLEDQRGWLEDRLIAADFGDFVAQLDLIIEAASDLPQDCPSRRSLDDIKAENRTWMVSDGFDQLSAEQFQQLLKSPEALVELNQEILVTGGVFWDSKIANLLEDRSIPQWSPSDSGRSESTKVESETASPEESGETLATPLEDRESQDSSAQSGAKYVLMGLAAALLLLIGGVVLFRGDLFKAHNNEVAIGWGWEQEDWFDEAKTRDAYIDRLVQGAKAWSAKPVPDREAYIVRLKALMRGCQRVIDSDHPLLSSAQQRELYDLCMKWQAKFIGQLELVLRDPHRFESVKSETDATISKAIIALENLRGV